MTIHDIQSLVAARSGVTVLELLSQRQNRAVVRPRHIAIWLCRHCTPASLPSIARDFGGRDHTTILHAIRRVDELIASDQVVAAAVLGLRHTITSREART